MRNVLRHCAWPCRVLLFVLSVCIARPQGVITTVAGTDWSFPGTAFPTGNAPLADTNGVAVDRNGNIYFVDKFNNLVLRQSPDGLLTVIAGNGIAGFSGDGGRATNASMNLHGGLAVDNAGNVYVADTDNNRVRKISSDGIITTIAGNGRLEESGNGGPATSAGLYGTKAVAVDSTGSLYIAEYGRIRKVTPDGIISIFAGTFQAAGLGDGGPAANASLDPYSLAFDARGNLFVADAGSTRIRMIKPDGTITSVAGNGTSGGYLVGDGGPATQAQLYFPQGVAVDAAGNIYIADTFNSAIRKVTPDGIIRTIAGTHFVGLAGDGGPATAARLFFPEGVGVDATGNVFIADSANQRIRKVTPDGIIRTIAGNGSYRFRGDNGPATSAAFNRPNDFVVDSSGNLFIADTDNNRIRAVNNGGLVSTIAGNGVTDFTPEGSAALSTSVSYPQGMAFDAGGLLLYSDGAGCMVRRLSAAGTITTIAGSRGLCPAVSSGDNLSASSASLSPGSLAVDLTGNLYIADNFNHVVRKVTPGGTISTFAGTGKAGFSGDNGPAATAQLNAPLGVGVDSGGNVYIADTENCRVRSVTPAGVIKTIAGSGNCKSSGDGGLAIQAGFKPNGVSADRAGNLYIADFVNNVVRKITPSGIISTIAGNGNAGFSGDGGAAIQASLRGPGVARADAAGNVYIADVNNSRIRVVLAQPPGVQVSPTQLQFSASSGGAIPPAKTVTFTGQISGIAFSAQVPVTSSWLHLSAQAGASPSLLDVTADPTNLRPGTYSSTIILSSPLAVPASTSITVAFTVSAGQPPQLSVDKQSLSFPFPSAGKARSQFLTLSNTGGGTLQFSASARTNFGGSWLSVAPASGTALPSAPASLTVTANPAGLPPGTYTGVVSIAGVASTTIPVTMTISELNQALLLSQAGLSFIGVSNGGVVPPQTFGVINIGSGVVNWKVTTSTLSGGSAWLQVDTSSGSTDAAANVVPVVGVRVNPSILPAGNYYGQVRVDAPGAANSPQVLTVSLQVLQAGSETGAIMRPAQLLFAPALSGGSPGSQELMLYNVAAQPKTFHSLVSADRGLRLVVQPGDGTLDPKQPTRIVVQPFTDGLSAGVYNGTVTLQFSDGLVLAVKLTVIVPNGSSALTTSFPDLQPSQVGTGSCQATRLLVVLSSLGQSFTVAAGYPVALAAEVKDDCGIPLDTPGTVVVSFSNGDPALSLTSVKGGFWERTWQTQSANRGQVTLKVRADDPQRQLHGEGEFSGASQATTDPPVFPKEGIVSAAGGQSFVPLAPGSIISIYGERLAQNIAPATVVPLSTSLAQANVVMAGQALPLFYVSPNQVNAQVPFDINVNTTQQVLVLRGPTLSQPVPVDVAPAQPAIFKDASVSPNQGVIYVVRAQGTTQVQFEAKPDTPARAGDVIVIYCAGLGTVDPKVPAGAAAGVPLSKTINAVQVTVGGQNAAVAFAGLTPAFVGLYQINAVVPVGAPTGNAVPVVISVAGQTIPAAFIAIQ